MIALSLAPNIGPVTSRKLIGELGSVRAVLSRKEADLRKIRGIGARLAYAICSPDLMERSAREMEFIEKHHIRAITYLEEDYPQKLNECLDGPIVIYVHGHMDLNKGRFLSVVGTRNATPWGKEICREFVGKLASMFDDLVIISGLAYGIDVCAHRQALESGIRTIAVLGHGLSTIYPHVHRETAKKIGNQGCLLTDFHSGMGPERNNFLRRNRIIAGISQYLLVVESGITGGALTTASMAASYNRELFTIPGRINDPRSAGCNRLILENRAHMVLSPEDVAWMTGWLPDELRDQEVRQTRIFPGEDEQKILDAIRLFEEAGPGTISQHTGIPIQKVLSTLLEMELKTWIFLLPGNIYRLSGNVV
jgi:DNA processing protein